MRATNYNQFYQEKNIKVENLNKNNIKHNLKLTDIKSKKTNYSLFNHYKKDSQKLPENLKEYSEKTLVTHHKLKAETFQTSNLSPSNDLYNVVDDEDSNNFSIQSKIELYSKNFINLISNQNKPSHIKNRNKSVLFLPSKDPIFSENPNASFDFNSVSNDILLLLKINKNKNNNLIGHGIMKNTTNIGNDTKGFVDNKIESLFSDKEKGKFKMSGENLFTMRVGFFLFYNINFVWQYCKEPTTDSSKVANTYLTFYIISIISIICLLNLFVNKSFKKLVYFCLQVDGRLYKNCYVLVIKHA